MSNKNPKHINDLLIKIGLIENKKVLAQLRDSGQQGNHYDLILLTDPETAANMVEKKLGIKANHFDDDGSYYWEFSIENEWNFCFEQYRSGNIYMTATDLHPIEEEKPPAISIIDISNAYKALKEKFNKDQKELALQLKDNFIPQMADMLKKTPSIKAIVWVQYSKWEGGMEYDFAVYQPYFLSFIPEEFKQYYNDSDLLKAEDFIITPYDLESTKKLNEEEKKICLKMNNILKNSDTLLGSIFGDHVGVCLTKDGSSAQHYDGY
jgi:hypothetical protein